MHRRLVIRLCIGYSDVSITGGSGKAKKPFGLPELTESDRRPSAFGVGGVAIAFVVILAVMILGFDMLNLFQSMESKKGKRGSKKKKALAKNKVDVEVSSLE